MVAPSLLSGKLFLLLLLVVDRVQLHKMESGTQEYAEFLHQPRRKFTHFALVRQEIQDETDRVIGKTK